MTTVSSQPQIPTQTEPAPAAQPATIGLQDIQNLLILVDLACQRGAYKAVELSQVGAVFDRVNAFMQSAVPQQPEPQEAASPMPPLPTPQAMPPQPVSPMSPPPFSPKTVA